MTATIVIRRKSLSMIVRARYAAVFSALLFVTLAGCNDNPSNSAPTTSIVSGNPPSSAVVGSLYQFSPTIHSTGPRFNFSVTNRPAWAAFDGATGKLSGTPQAVNVGVYPNITISAGNGISTTALAPFSITVQPAADTGPTISGTPAKTVVVGADYSFRPTVTDAGNTPLNFAISNAPAWAKWDPATGTLSGTPTAADTGTYAQILIAVSDAHGSSTLTPFSIYVMTGSSAVATITWTTPPIEATSERLSGYRVYYGTTVAGMTHVVNVNDPTLTSYVIDNLSSGIWYFAIASYDSNRHQGPLSPTVAVNL